ncbi:short-chain dehydrogenase (plasmid) [Pantoea cypripedii]|uniref:Short-chain dehydrogenase n=2 Tax=Pantoea cypripedii TaxID=55209 RepID=A0A6B9G6P9_PANCY|nr:short-chain dehydrogenase [Pantoea cypripedii]
MAQVSSIANKELSMNSVNSVSTGKSRIFITGSSDGLGLAAATSLLEQGHDVVVHVRTKARLSAVKTLLDKGAVATIGDLSDTAQIRVLAQQVNAIGKMDAVIHNAGIISGTALLVVNVVAPYMLTSLIERPQRIIYLSSSMHSGGSENLNGLDWTGHTSTASYSDSKLFVTTLAIAVARLWPEVYSNAVDPGWVPTKMGGANAPDDLTLGHVTQEWLATSHDPAALTSGNYWYHQQKKQPNPAVKNIDFQNNLLAQLAHATGIQLV